MNEKELIERRAALIDEMQQITDNATNVEKRTLNDDEQKEFAKKQKEVEHIDATLRALETSRNSKLNVPVAVNDEKPEDIDIRTFASIIKTRVDSNITYSDNGAVIPKTIVNKIIDRVREISPLFRDMEKFNIKGTVSIPYVDTASDNITVAYADEFTELEAKSSKLLTVNLTGYLAGVLCKISKSLLNNTDIDIANFVIGKMSCAIALFLDNEIIGGKSGKIAGLSNVEQIVTAASATAITSDDLIDLKDSLKSMFQGGAYWIMSPKTFTAVKKLKDGEGRYLFNDDIVNGFAGKILGKPVYTTDQCPDIAAGKSVIYYINTAEALSGKMIEDSMQVLNEKYATQHAIGIVAYIEVDAKIQNQQAVAVLKMRSE